MIRPVYIASSGLLCARGDSLAKVRDALWAGECSSGKRRLGEREFPYFSLPLNEADWLKRAQLALSHVAHQLGPLAPDTALFIASSSFPMGHFEAQGRPSNPTIISTSLSYQVAEWMQLRGPRYHFSNACISGFSAIDAARSLIAAGQIDEAIIVGIELANHSTRASSTAMELLSPTTCQPFDVRRDGLVLGEAVAAVRLSAKPATWRISGLRTGIDAYSPTIPNPQGGPIAKLAVNCIKEAKIKPADIELVKLQAAGSPAADLAEANALRQIFGNTLPPLLSLKPYLGHTLGASGIAELVTLLACLTLDQIPATAGFKKVDPEIALFPMVDRSNAHIQRALLNLIGFGGGLASLIIERRA